MASFEPADLSSPLSPGEHRWVQVGVPFGIGVGIGLVLVAVLRALFG